MNTRTPAPRNQVADSRPTLPHNLEAERSILGAILVRNSALDTVRDRITPGDFYIDAHRRIFAAMIALSARAVAIDFLTVNTELGDQIDAVGGPGFVARLCDGMPASTNVEAYAGIVVEQAQLRRVIFAANEALTDAYAKDAPPAVIAARLSHQLAKIPATDARDGFTDDELADAVAVAQQGREIEATGVPYVVDGIVPAFGMLGFLVAFAKVGKTTFGQALAAHVAMGRRFLDRATDARRVLILAAEDPPEYTALIARHLEVAPGRMTFRRASLALDLKTLDRIIATIRAGGYGFVLIASWQAVIRGLLREENDNLGHVNVVEDVKAAARVSGVPWLIDAHSGKGEDQRDDADPTAAMRGASGAAGAADYALSLRYGNGTFGTLRRLSGKGRFVSLAPITMDFDAATSTYTATGSTKDTTTETTWRLICEMGALDATPKSATELGHAAGLIPVGGKGTATERKRIAAALKGRAGVGLVQELRRGQLTNCYRQLSEGC